MKNNEHDTDPVTGEEYWAQKGDVSLFIWRRRSTTALAREAGPPVLLVHGSSMSALPTFDLEVPGHPDYSFMAWLAERGHDVWTLDHEGYGRSTITSGNSDIATGVDDLEAAVEVICRETGADALHVYGLSSGALRAACFAEKFPHRVARLVLDGFVWTGEGSSTLGKRRENLDFFRTHNRRPIDRASIATIFTRDKPGTTDPAVADACAMAQLVFGDSVPTGSYLDMTTKLPLVEPTRIIVPTLVVRGEHDGIASMDDLAAFFIRLPNPDKQFSVLPDLAHCTPLGNSRKRLWQAVKDFFDRSRTVG